MSYWWQCGACDFLNDSGETCCDCCGSAAPVQRSAGAGASVRSSSGRGAEVLVLDDDSDEDRSLQLPVIDKKQSRKHQSGVIAGRDPVAAVDCDNSAVARQVLRPGCPPPHPDGGLFVLDGCGCTGAAEVLAADLNRRVQADVLRHSEPAGRSSASVWRALNALRCGACGRLLSAGDALQLLGAQQLAHVYAALAATIKASHGLRQPPPQCPCGGAILALAELGSSGSSSSSSAGSGGGSKLPPMALMASALRARAQIVPSRQQDAAAALLAFVSPAGCTHVCTRCQATWPPDDSSATAAAGHSGEMVDAVAGALHIWGVLLQLEQLLLGVGPQGRTVHGPPQPGTGRSGGGGGSGGRRGQGGRHGRHSGGHRGGRKGQQYSAARGAAAWAAGTGASRQQ